MECRFCKEDTNLPENPLISPCDCTGTMAYVHNDCLIAAGDRFGHTCPICKRAFVWKIINMGPIPIVLFSLFEKIKKGIGLSIMFYIVFFLIYYWCNLFLFSPLTWTLVVYVIMYHLIIIIILSFITAFQLVQPGTMVRELYIQKTVLNVSNIIGVFETIYACYHIFYTGWESPVIYLLCISGYGVLYSYGIEPFYKYYAENNIKIQYQSNINTND